jgi:hypothetical protein
VNVRIASMAGHLEFDCGRDALNFGMDDSVPLDNVFAHIAKSYDVQKYGREFWTS